MWLGRCAGLVGFFGVLCCTCRVARVEALPSTAWDVCPRRVPRRRATRAQRNTQPFPRVWGRGAQPQLMRSAGLIVLVRAFFAALQPHPRVSGAVGGVSQLSCACLPCCPPTASPRQWGRGGRIAAGLGHRSGALAWLRPGSWPRRATKHSVLCVRWPSFSLGQECTAASFGCQGARKRPGDRGPADAVKRRVRNKMVAGARESALATAGSLTL